MDLDITTYIQPQWWSQSWGWIAFMLHEPDYQAPPFSSLMIIPRRLRRLPGTGKYEMPSHLVDCWSKLEADLTMATYLLQVYYGVPAIRPVYPLGFGYKHSHLHEGAGMRAIYKSQKWFSVWLALFSFLIAMAETKENELHDYEHLSKKEWADYLLSKGAEITWLESVINSAVFRFDAEVIRSGTFLHLSAQSFFQPSVSWFLTYHVPVWYPWGPEEASKPHFAEYAPPTDLLQSSTTTIAKSPRQLQLKTSDNSSSQDTVSGKTTKLQSKTPDTSSSQDPVTGNTTVLAPKETDTSSSHDVVTANTTAVDPPIPESSSCQESVTASTTALQSKILDTNPLQDVANASATETASTSNISQKENFLASWHQFLSSRKLLRQNIEQTETSVDKEKRLARERRPPTKSARVFHWTKDALGGYVRELVPKRWREDTLGEYCSKQVQYDSYLNEWDCCSELGSDDGLDELGDNEGPEEESHFEDYDQLSVEPSASQMTSTGFDDPVDDNEDWLPFCYQPQDTAYCPSIDGLEEEVLEEAHMHFGYITPLPSATLPAITDVQQQKHVMRFVGFSWTASFSALFNRPRILNLAKFITKLSASQAAIISMDEWDIDRQNRASVTFMDRFKFIVEISSPQGPLFMFNFHERSTVKWKLTVTSATHALLVCRLHSDFKEKDIALYFLRRGIPFYTLQESNTLHRVLHDTEKPSQRPVRPVDHKFTLLDYTTYLDQCRVLMQQKRLRAALLRGGYLWRVALSAMYFDAVLDGPSGLSSREDEMFSVTLPDGKQYVDDQLTAAETYVLLGTYVCRTGNAFF